MAYLVSEKESHYTTGNFCTKYYQQHEEELKSNGDQLINKLQLKTRQVEFQIYKNIYKLKVAIKGIKMSTYSSNSVS